MICQEFSVREKKNIFLAIPLDTKDLLCYNRRRFKDIKGEKKMLKEYTFNFSFGNQSGVGYLNARNTEELESLAWPFRVEIVSVRLAK